MTQHPLHNISRPEVSIVVPVYNVEAYLPQCLESIRNQSFTDWECFLVDDGSTDKSGQICEEFAGRDSRFKVIHKENGGLSSARNAALPHLNGNFVAFVDSDDWVEPSYLSVMIDLAQKNNADIVQTGYKKDFNGFSRKKPLTRSEKIIEGEELYSELLKNSMIPSFMWNKLFRKEVITEKFPQGKAYEDFQALNNWIPQISRIVVSPEMTYHYRMRKGSITATKNPKSLGDFYEGISNRWSVIEQQCPSIVNETVRIDYLFRNYINIAKKLARSGIDQATCRSMIHDIGKELKKLPEPSKEILGKKLYKRAGMLMDSPDAFVKSMKAASMWDLHSRFCNARLFK